MSTFVCPECGHSNEYDEWSDSARCSQCGFEPPAGEDMQPYLQEQNGPQTAAIRREDDPESERSQITGFLPKSGRSFITGLVWGVLAFAIVMFISSRLAWSASVARCLGIALPVLTTFVVWKIHARRETLE